MSNFKKKPQVRPEIQATLIKGQLFTNGNRIQNCLPVGAAFTDATLPDPTGLVDGLMAYNSDIEEIMVTHSGAWVATDFGKKEDNLPNV